MKCRLLLLGSSDAGRTWRRVSEVWQDRYFAPQIPAVFPDAALNGPSEACLLRTVRRGSSAPSAPTAR